MARGQIEREHADWNRGAGLSLFLKVGATRLHCATASVIGIRQGRPAPERGSPVIVETRGTGRNRCTMRAGGSSIFLAITGPRRRESLAISGAFSGALRAGARAAALFGILHGESLLLLVIFGPSGYGHQQGVLMVPARVAQALAPWVFGAPMLTTIRQFWPASGPDGINWRHCPMQGHYSIRHELFHATGFHSVPPVHGAATRTAASRAGRRPWQ